jgi:hypothetical protein
MQAEDRRTHLQTALREASALPRPGVVTVGRGGMFGRLEAKGEKRADGTVTATDLRRPWLDRVLHGPDLVLRRR